jgi:hypothetical protein
MNFNFVISRQSLFVTALLQTPKIDKWIDLQNELWDKYRLGYQLLQGNVINIFESEDSKDLLEQAAKEVQLLIEDGMKTPQFVILLKNAEEYKLWLQNEWETNKKRVVKDLTDILRIELPKDVFTVVVMGNLMHIGRHIGNKKILWGHKEDWPNYSIVYLTHELLHSIFKNTDIEHSIIELCADNELRIRLNGEGAYFICDNEKIGHSYLQDIEKQMLTDWKIYLKDKSKNIYHFLEEQEKKQKSN